MNLVLRHLRKHLCKLDFTDIIKKNKGGEDYKKRKYTKKRKSK